MSTQSAARPASVEPLVITPPSGFAGLGLRELWHYRELLYFLTWRDLKLLYKQTVLGAAWAVIQPVLLMVVFSLFFGRLAGVPHGDVPYPIFAYAGLLPWLFFANSMSFSAQSLVANAQLITKVYFPRLIVAVTPALAALVDFALALGVLFVLMVYYDVYPEPLAWLMVFPLILLAMVTALGVGTWLSALNVKYRDIRYVIPFLTQLWLFATPVVYPASLIDEPWRTLYGLNPMAGVVEGFRWALIDAGEPPGPMLAVSALVALALLVTGVVHFRRTEETFADVV
jgi:lipopolysaccharide transport system permease protein